VRVVRVDVRCVRQRELGRGMVLTELRAGGKLYIIRTMRNKLFNIRNLQVFVSLTSATQIR
jgi:hypothetical protein